MRGNIRNATENDIIRITAIYNQAIKAGYCTADQDSVSEEQKLNWLNNRTEEYPVIVYELQHQVVAFAYLTPYRGGRAAFNTIAEVSYYVDFDFHRKGIAKALIRFIIQIALHSRFENLIAMVLAVNINSIALLTAHGFVLWAKLPQIAKIGKFNIDHHYYGLSLKDLDTI